VEKHGRGENDKIKSRTERDCKESGIDPQETAGWKEGCVNSKKTKRCEKGSSDPTK
jgi:hypothetical protein